MTRNLLTYLLIYLQTDSFLEASPRWHSMQHGKNLKINNAVQW